MTPPVVITPSSPLLVKFRRAAEAQTGNKSTSRTYLSGAALFFKYFNGKGRGMTTSAEWAGLVGGDITDWALWMLGKGYSRSSCKVYIAGLFYFFDWMRDRGVAVPQLKHPRLPKTRKVIRTALGEADLQRYFYLADGVVEPYRTMLRLLPLSGLRIGEICQLAADDVQTQERGYVFLIREGEGQVVKSDDRVVPIVHAGTPIIRKYIESYFAQKKPIPRWFFPIGHTPTKTDTRRWKHPSSKTLSKYFDVVRRGMDMKSITPHTMRHTYATMLERAGVSSLKIAAILGHKSLSTTQGYVHMGTNDLFDAVDKVDIATGGRDGDRNRTA